MIMLCLMAKGRSLWKAQFSPAGSRSRGQGDCHPGMRRMGSELLAVETEGPRAGSGDGPPGAEGTARSMAHNVKK